MGSVRHVLTRSIASRARFAPIAPIVLGALLALPCACSSKSSPPARILFIGVDGATWDIAGPMIEQGELPHLAALVQRGFASELDTIQPSLSPVIWTCIATGKTMEEHGITDFVTAGPDGNVEPVLSNAREVRALWEILSEHDVRVGIVGWWLTWPAEIVLGCMVSSLSVLEAGLWKGSAYQGLPKQIHPPGWSADLDRIVGEQQGLALQTVTALFGELPQDYGNQVQRRVIIDTKSALISDAIFCAAAEEFLPRTDATFAAVYFGIVDVAAHRFWKYFRPGDKKFTLRPGEVEALGEVIPNAYRWVDARIGELVARAGPDTIVIVASDHGFHAERRPGMDEDERTGGHERALLPGILVVAGPGIAHADLRGDADAERPSIYDLAPTILHLCGLPRAKDMQGRIFADLFTPEFNASHPPATEVETYETAPRFKVELSSGDLESIAKAQQGIVSRLRSLGYLDDVKPEEPEKLEKDD